MALGKPESVFKPRQRIIRRKMGHKDGEDEHEIIEMCESNSKREESEDSEQAESEVMIRHNKKIFVPKEVAEENGESFWIITIQVFFPFLIAGLGMVGAGLVLDIVQVRLFLYFFNRIIKTIYTFWYQSSLCCYLQHWSVFESVSKLFILIPSLLGLKGNLEMTLASRLSTQANLGHLDTHDQQWSLIKSNMALIQVTSHSIHIMFNLMKFNY